MTTNIIDNVLNKTGTVAAMNEGTAVFDTLFFNGIHNQTYEVTFSIYPKYEPARGWLRERGEGGRERTE